MSLDPISELCVYTVLIFKILLYIFYNCFIALIDSFWPDLSSSSKKPSDFVVEPKITQITLHRRPSRASTNEVPNGVTPSPNLRDHS